MASPPPALTRSRRAASSARAARFRRRRAFPTARSASASPARTRRSRSARTALAAICAASHQKSAALDHNAAAFGHAADDEEKYTCHKNAAHLLRQAAENPDDPENPIPASSDDLQVAQHHDDEAAALEAKIKAKGDEPDTKTNKIGAAGDDDDDESSVPGDDDAPEEFVGDDEELPPIDGVDAFDVPIDEQ